MIAPELEPHCGSWIVSRGGRALFETFDRRTADVFAGKGYTVQTAAQYLGAFNRALRIAAPIDRPA